MMETAKLDYIFNLLARPWDDRELGIIFRHCLDRAIDFPNTGTIRVEDIEKSAKTAIGTHVEVALRKLSGLPHGPTLDLILPDETQVDIKWSTGQRCKPGVSWMIPTETFGHYAAIATAWDCPETSFFSLGFIGIEPDGSNLSAPNKDQKRGIPKSTRESAMWLYRNEEMPRNILLSKSDEEIAEIYAASAGVQRMAKALKLFGSLTAMQIKLFDTIAPLLKLPEVREILSQDHFNVGVDTDGTWHSSPK